MRAACMQDEEQKMWAEFAKIRRGRGGAGWDVSAAGVALRAGFHCGDTQVTSVLRGSYVESSTVDTAVTNQEHTHNFRDNLFS